MNDQQSEWFKAGIQARLAELDAEDEAGKDARGTVELDQQSVGRLSRMDALQGQAMARATHQRRAQERRRLHEALDRLARGTYGECADCGEPISPRRLDLDLAATLCIDCARG